MTMLVIVARKESPRLIGLVSRLLIGIETGVWAGSIPRRAAENLMASISDLGVGETVAIYTAATESGYGIRYFGSVSRCVVDNFGLPLVKRTKRSRHKEAKPTQSID